MIQIKLFIIALPIFLLLDFIWLGLIAKNFYKTEFGSLALRVGDNLAPNWTGVAVTYLLLVAGLVFLVINPNSESDLSKLLLSATIFGLTVYGTYDLTNYSTLVNWSVKLTIIDMVWGMAVCATTSVLTLGLYKLIIK